MPVPSSDERLVERVRELAALAELLTGLADGPGRMPVIVGPAGIGKSELLRALCTRASQAGALVLRARATELEHEFSFGVVRTLFEAELAHAPAARRARLLAGAAGLAASLVADAPAAATAASAAADDADADHAFAALHGLYWLTANLAQERPLVLAVDDAQWADAPSLRFLAYLAARLEGLPVLLAVCARPPTAGTAGTAATPPALLDALVNDPSALRADPPALLDALVNDPGALRVDPAALLGALADDASALRVDPAALLGALVDDPAALRIDPAPLTGAGVAAVVRSRLDDPDPAFCDAVATATGGNPFLLRELLTALVDDGIEPSATGAAIVAELGPQSISRAVLARLGRLGPAAVAVTRAVAVQGAGAELGAVAALAELDVAEAAAAVDALAAADVLVADPGLDFVHPVVRAAIYDAIPGSLRARMHRRAAERLAEQGADAEAVAAQLLESRPAGAAWACERLRAAAALALARGAPDAAVRYLRQARAESPDGDSGALLRELGTALALAGERDAAIELLTAARDRLDDPRERAGATRALAAALMVEPARVVDGVELLSAAIADLPAGERELGVRLEGDIATAGFITLAGGRAAARHAPRFVDAESPQGLAAAAMANVLREGPAETAAALAQRALAGGRLLAEETADSKTFWLAALALLWAQDLRGADAVMSAAMAEAAARGSARGVALAACFRSHARLLLGAVRDAEADARRMLELDPGLFAIGPAFLIESLVEQGRLEEARDAVTERWPSSIETAMFHFRLRSRGLLRIRLGQLEDGLADLRALAAGFADWGTSTPGPIQWRPLAAEALARLGRVDEARTMIASELRACRAFGAPTCLGTALRADGLLADDPDRAIALLGESAALLAPTPARLEHARSLVELGAALRRAGSRAAARDPLATGLAQARRCGATALAARAHAELEASGARPRKILRSGLDALTPSELRIARMAAQGAPNKAIAQELFVTVRTVETHLHAAFRKLDVTSRRQLAGALEDAADGDGDRSAA